MAIIWFIFIIFPCHCAVYMYKITILQKPLSQFPPNFTLILLLKFRNHLAEFHQISHWSFCWNVFDNLFKWSCSIDCQAHIFFFKTKNCSNDDIFISCDDRTGKMLHNICMSAVAMSLRWANCGPWASCLSISFFFFSPSQLPPSQPSHLFSFSTFPTTLHPLLPLLHPTKVLFLVEKLLKILHICNVLW